MNPNPAAHGTATLRFLGAADTVTGSRYLVTVGDRRENKDRNRSDDRCINEFSN